MELDPPIYALQRTASGTWLMLAPTGDPFLPAIIIVDVIGDLEEIAVTSDQYAVEETKTS